MDAYDVLVVDDDSAIRELFHIAFTKAGYSIETAGSAEEALEKTRMNHFKVVFVDLRLPKMNGIELCKVLKTEFEHLRIFAITGYASIYELSECISVGFDDYFRKPVNISVLIDAAAKNINKTNGIEKA